MQDLISYLIAAGLLTAAGTATAGSLPLPTNLGGSSVTLTDSGGAQVSPPLCYAGPSQINAAIPTGIYSGPAVVPVSTPSGSQTCAVQIAAVAPGLSSANANGTGVAAAQIVAASDVSQAFTPVFDCAPGRLRERSLGYQFGFVRPGCCIAPAFATAVGSPA